MSKNDLLSVGLNSTGTKLVIEIGINPLLHGLLLSRDWPSNMVISDRDAFLAAFIKCLRHETEENGETLIYRAFDDAAIRLIEWGFDGVDDADKDGEALEQALLELRAEMGNALAIQILNDQDATKEKTVNA